MFNNINNLNDLRKKKIIDMWDLLHNFFKIWFSEALKQNLKREFFSR
jgi:hypothetical protein